jgi:enterochelin esterase-like enzyme
MKYSYVVLMSSACAALLAQAPQPAANLVSPEAHPDKSVTFRMWAPKAAEVTLTGDWLPANTNPKFTKDDKGVWSLTIGPLEPSIYIYNFNVDGIAMADPVNPRMKLRARTSASLVEIPADAPAFWQERDVPHGKVEINWRKSKVLNGETRWIWIYTPPGYDKNTRKYPVLYLFHGNNDTAAGWTLVGQANFILDNLLAEKKATPMIVVMPFGHAAPFGAKGNDELFENYLLQDVVPLVESEYRVETGRDKRAIAGLSMGGAQSVRIGFGHLDMFSAIGGFSSGPPDNFAKNFAPALQDAKGTNSKLKALWIGCGKQDDTFARSERLSQILEKNQIKHTFRVIDGVHNYTAWKKFLEEFARLLFR